MSCSVITSVNCRPVAGALLTVAVGQAFTVVASFETAEEGTDCEQLLNWYAEANGAAPFSYDDNDPSFENTEYSKTYVPTEVGTHVLGVNVVYRTEDGGPRFLIKDSATYGNTITLRVVRGEVGELPTDTHTEAVPSDDAGDDEVESDASVESVYSDAFVEEIETDTLTEDIDHDA